MDSEWALSPAGPPSLWDDIPDPTMQGNPPTGCLPGFAEPTFPSHVEGARQTPTLGRLGTSKRTALASGEKG